MRTTIGIMLVLAFVVPASAVIYVAPGGSDANPGTAALPKLTIQNAVWAANAALDGLVEVAAGTYAGFYHESAPAGGGAPGVGNDPGMAVLPLTVYSATGWKNTVINTPTIFSSPAYYPQTGAPVAGTNNPYANLYGGGAGHDALPWVSVRSNEGQFPLTLDGFTVRGDALDALGNTDTSEYAGNADATDEGIEAVCGVAAQNHFSGSLTTPSATVKNSVITGFVGNKFNLMGERYGFEGWNTASGPALAPNGQVIFNWFMSAGVRGGMGANVRIENSLLHGNLAGAVLGVEYLNEQDTVVNSTFTDNQIAGIIDNGTIGSTVIGHFIDSSIIYGNGDGTPAIPFFTVTDPNGVVQPAGYLDPVGPPWLITISGGSSPSMPMWSGLAGG